MIRNQFVYADERSVYGDGFFTIAMFLFYFRKQNPGLQQGWVCFTSNTLDRSKKEIRYTGFYR